MPVAPRLRGGKGGALGGVAVPRNLQPFHGHEYLRIDPQDGGRERREWDGSAPPFRPKHGRKNGAAPLQYRASDLCLCHPL